MKRTPEQLDALRQKWARQEARANEWLWNGAAIIAAILMLMGIIETSINSTGVL